MPTVPAFTPVYATVTQATQAISSPSTGQVVIILGSPSGYYSWTGSAWVKFQDL